MKTPIRSHPKRATRLAPRRTPPPRVPRNAFERWITILVELVIEPVVRSIREAWHGLWQRLHVEQRTPSEPSVSPSTTSSPQEPRVIPNKAFLLVFGLLASMAIVFRVAPAAAILVVLGLMAIAYFYYSRFLRP